MPGTFCRPAEKHASFATIMDFIDKLRELASNAQSSAQYSQTEEATKTALVLPFLQVLGYNIFDPTEVVPEFVADVGQKKGEKVDYAIIRKSEPILLIECKSSHADLTSENATQLYRYFTATPARFGILTNGLVYRFFSDLEEPNKMDPNPFMEFDLREEITPKIAETLKKFGKEGFDLESSLSGAKGIKYDTSIKKLLAEQLKRPSDDFVLFILGQVYRGTKTKKIKESFVKITQEAFREFVNDQVQKRLQKAIEEDDDGPERQPSPAVTENGDEDQESRIVTTEEERMGYYIVKSVLFGHVATDRIFLRDHITYCNILLDNKTLRAICRFRFNPRKKTVEIPDGKKGGERIPLNTVDDLYGLQDRLIARVSWLLQQ